MLAEECEQLVADWTALARRMKERPSQPSSKTFATIAAGLERAAKELNAALDNYYVEEAGNAGDTATPDPARSVGRHRITAD